MTKRHYRPENLVLPASHERRKSSGLVYIVGMALFCLIPNAGCDDYAFEVISEISSADTASTSEQDTETESDSESNKVSWRDIFDGIDDCAQLTPVAPTFEADEIITVGDGTPDRCQELDLLEAVQTINQSGRGKIEFHCGGNINEILLTGPIVVEENVQMVVDGGLTTVLDGRGVFRILEAREGSDVFFERTVFIDGTANGEDGGGAVYIDNSISGGRAVFSECVFKGNLSEQGAGGAIYAYRLDHLEIFRCVFQENFAASGGAVFYFGNQIQVANTDFYGNWVYQDGGAVIFREDESGTDTETNARQFYFCGNRFSDNYSIGDGSGLKIMQAETSHSDVSFNEFLQNRTSEEFTPTDGAGALNLRGGSLMLNSSSFVRNASAGSVGGVYMNTDNGFSAENCTFFLNTSEEGTGGAIFQRDANPGVITNCSFVRNSAREGGAIYREDGSALEVFNSIFIDNLREGEMPGSCNTTFSGAHNFEWVDGFSELEMLCTENSTVENALLMSPAYNGGFVLTCRMDSTSAARDVGENCPFEDARGETRSSPCDAGSFEVVEE